MAPALDAFPEWHMSTSCPASQRSRSLVGVISGRGVRVLRLGVVLALIGLATTLVVALRMSHRPPTASECVASDGSDAFALDPTQAANAATIAGVAARKGLSDHAVSIALATALQESKLHNISYGDRDSVGLFQQRPSQGWGSRQLLLDPRYAAAAFYRRLLQVPGWKSMPVATAAQAVQRSADGSAYAGWDRSARVLAEALTGEVPHALSCSFATPRTPRTGLSTVLADSFGPAALGPAPSPKRGWAVAAALVAQAAVFGVEAVSFDGYRWTRRSGRWAPHAADVNRVRYSLRARS